MFYTITIYHYHQKKKVIKSPYLDLNGLAAILNINYLYFTEKKISKMNVFQKFLWQLTQNYAWLKSFRFE